MKHYDSFALWQKDQTKANQTLIRMLTRLVHETAPKLIEAVKWGNGCFVNANGLPIVFIYPDTDHVQLGFFIGSMLKDPMKVLEGKGKFVRHVKIYKTSDIDASVLTKLVKQAEKTIYR